MLVPPLLPTQGEQITVKETGARTFLPLPAEGAKLTCVPHTDDWTYQDYSFPAEKNAKFLRQTEWLLRDKRTPREPPFFVIFRLLGPGISSFRTCSETRTLTACTYADDEFVSEPHAHSHSLVSKPPSYFHDHSSVERRDLSPTAPSYTQKPVRPKTLWTEQGKELFALRVRAFLGLPGRTVRFRGMAADAKPLSIECTARLSASSS